MNGQQILEADKDPSKYPNLVVRVTGFTAYFCSLTPEFRKLVVDRILIQDEQMIWLGFCFFYVTVLLQKINPKWQAEQEA